MQVLDIINYTLLFMFNLSRTLLILLWLATTVVYAGLPETSFSIGQYANSNDSSYANDQYKQTILTIPNAEALEVIVEGEIEDCCQSPTNENVERCCHRSRNKRCCDFIIIRDSENQDHTFNGQIQEKFTVLGHSVTVIFKSDNATTGRGVRVSISPRSALDVFNELKIQISTAADTILKQGTSEVHSKLEQQLKQLETLTEQVENIQNIDEVIEPVARMLTALGQTYHEIASKRDTIILAHQMQLSLIKELEMKTLNRIDRAIQEKQNHVILLNNAQNALLQTSNSLERQKIQISISGHKQNIESLQLQEMVWSKFHDSQETLENLLQQYTQKIELLLHFLEISGQVYEQAANVALLKETTVIAFNKLTDVTELENIVMDIEQSEQKIKAWMNKIKQDNFQQNNLP